MKHWETLDYEGNSPLAVDGVPVHHLRRQVVRFGVEVRLLRVGDTEAEVADGLKRFAGSGGDELIEVRLGHLRLLPRKKKRRPDDEAA